MLAQAIRKKLGKAVKEEKGFTLIELLAVIVIIGIIAVIAIPMISNILSKSRVDADVATARQIYDAARLYVIGEKNGQFTETTTPSGGTATTTGRTITIVSSTNTDSLMGTGYLETPLYLPSTKAQIDGGTVVFSSTGALVSVTISTDGTEPDPAVFTAAEVLKSEPTSSRK